MQDRLDLDSVDELSSAGSSSTARRAHVRQAREFRKIEEEVLLPTDLRRLLPEGDASLWIREGLSHIDLSVLRDMYGDYGGVAYDPRAMLGILLYAYFEGETGSRTIEKRCREPNNRLYASLYRHPRLRSGPGHIVRDRCTCLGDGRPNGGRRDRSVDAMVSGMPPSLRRESTNRLNASRATCASSALPPKVG